MGKRSKARECALQMLYQWDMTREPMDRVAGLFWQVRSGTDEMKAMAERLARGAQADLERLDEAVELAKRFGEADSPAFVNGVLDAVRRAVRDKEQKKAE